MRPSILIFCRYYLPGVRAGGPIVTISNFIELVADQYDFKVVTGDRDHGDQESYQEIEQEVWHELGRANVCYTPPGIKRYITFIKIIRKAAPDYIYLNSLFDIHLHSIYSYLFFFAPNKNCRRASRRAKCRCAAD